MATWVKAQTPTICERAIGFSVPAANEFVVISYEGLHRVRMGGTIEVETDEKLSEYAAYDPAAGVAHYDGRDYSIVGLHGGKPLVTTEQGESLQLDKSSETLSILQGDVAVFAMRYENVSGDWAVATFSREGDRLVLGCPCGFDFVILERAG